MKQNFFLWGYIGLAAVQATLSRTHADRPLFSRPLSPSPCHGWLRRGRRWWRWTKYYIVLIPFAFHRREVWFCSVIIDPQHRHHHHHHEPDTVIEVVEGDDEGNEEDWEDEPGEEEDDIFPAEDLDVEPFEGDAPPLHGNLGEEHDQDDDHDDDSDENDEDDGMPLIFFTAV